MNARLLPLVFLLTSPFLHAGDAVTPAAVGEVTWKTRETVFLKKLFGLQAVYETVPGTIFDQARGFPEQWGRGGTGFAKRLGSQYGQFVASDLIETGVQAIHKEDPRYFRLGQGGIWHRTRYSLVSSFWVRKPGGGHTFAWSLPASVYGSWAIATRWSPPDLQTPFKIVQWGSFGMGIKVSANVFREFWPDVKQRVFKKKISDSPPCPPTDPALRKPEIGHPRPHTGIG